MSLPARAAAASTVALLLWTAGTSWDDDRGALARTSALLLAAAAVLLLARRVGPGQRCAVSLALSGAIVIAALLDPGALTPGALGWPLGYANANAALLTVAVGAALVAAGSTDDLRLRTRSTGLGCAAVVLATLTGSLAGAGAAWLVLLAGVAVVHRNSHVAVALMLGVAVLSAAITTAVAIAPAGAAPAPVLQALHGRGVLWAEAVALAREEPLTGVGAGGFTREAPTAQRDDDLRWAHSLHLQQAAESGLIGVLLLLAVLVSVIGLLLHPQDRPARAGAVMVCGLLTHASVDHLAHFPVLVLAAAAAAGLAAGPVPAEHAAADLED